MSGKIPLVSTPKLESQSPLEAAGVRSIVTRRLVKGAVLGVAAWFVVTSALGAGPGWDQVGFAPWGWGSHHYPGHERPVDCSVWDDFDFDAPLRFGEGRHPHLYQHSRSPVPPEAPVPPMPPSMPVPPSPPQPPEVPGVPRPPGAPVPPIPVPPRAPEAPVPPHPYPPPGVPHRHESQVFNVSTSVSEIRLASMGFLGHGVLRVEPAPEGVDVVQIE
ncbi:hypothetical protein FRC06_010689, partial [Ceratobasidium sp. 370]